MKESRGGKQKLGAKGCEKINKREYRGNRE